MPTNKTKTPAKKTSAPRPPSIPMSHINRTGFVRFREDLLECGFDPDNPRDMSTCEWLVHCWTKDN